ncbi:MAG: MerR family transcriptional regulator [Lachnospiraceae bacterium]|nr:MerR family transcriptional regulator [Lachnospiraceae bacterium]
MPLGGAKMSLYTTGEAAKICNVTVRTIQYYDKEGIIHPSEISVGGRRLYSEEDINNLKKVCMIKSLGVSLAGIKEIMKDEEGEKVIQVFLEEQEKEIAENIDNLTEQVKRIRVVRDSIKESGFLPVNSNEDIEELMEEKKNIKKLRLFLLAVGIPVSIMEWTGIIYWIMSGNPKLFLVFLPIIIILSVFVFVIYYGRTKFLCPHCHTLFKPRVVEYIFANHTLKLRKLTCTSCGHKGMCIEKYSID